MIMTDSMFELEAVLRDHANRYPLMQPTDAVKLIFQNEFGGGHLIRDEEAFLEFLRREYASVEKDPTASLCENIGNGIVRIHLAALQEEDLAQLGKYFILSASRHKGTLESFLRKLEILHQLTVEGIFSFDHTALNICLSQYAAAGYPAVSHSEQYRKAYRPAYRIVCTAFLPDDYPATQ